MAHFWIQKTREAGQGWAALPLAGSAYRFAAEEPYIARADLDATPEVIKAARTSEQASVAVIIRAKEMLVQLVVENAEHWLLVVARESQLRVNGGQPVLGAIMLADRDEIRLGNGQRLYFSTERLPRVVEFPGAAQQVFCGRCRNPIEPRSPAVHCPACGTWSHQSADLPCWRYEGTTTCPLCDQSNEPAAGFRWCPDGL